MSCFFYLTFWHQFTVGTNIMGKGSACALSWTWPAITVAVRMGPFIIASFETAAFGFASRTAWRRVLATPLLHILVDLLSLSVAIFQRYLVLLWRA